MGNMLHQFFPPKDIRLTDEDLTDQTGKVYIITGGYSGIGLVLAKILFQKNATVYIAGRSKDKFDEAWNLLTMEMPRSRGRVEFLKLDLANQPTIKASAEEFMKKESRLDILINNAGVMAPPIDSKDTLGHDLMWGTNVLGPWVFSRSLLPILKSTAAVSPTGETRILWAASLLEAAPKVGVEFGPDTGKPKPFGTRQADYAQTKAANALLANEFAQRYGEDGVISVAYYPGNLKTDLGRHQSKLVALMMRPMLYDPQFGAYTMLYAGWSKDIGEESNGVFIWPFGRIATLSPALLAAMKSREAGGTGGGQQLWKYCESETGAYL